LESSFFFQAEDGIRARTVTGVQTCALPILEGSKSRRKRRSAELQLCAIIKNCYRAELELCAPSPVMPGSLLARRRPKIFAVSRRSEELRVGKGCGGRVQVWCGIGDACSRGL